MKKYSENRLCERKMSVTVKTNIPVIRAQNVLTKINFFYSVKMHTYEIFTTWSILLQLKSRN